MLELYMNPHWRQEDRDQFHYCWHLQLQCLLQVYSGCGELWSRECLGVEAEVEALGLRSLIGLASWWINVLAGAVDGYKY